MKVVVIPIAQTNCVFGTSVLPKLCDIKFYKDEAKKNKKCKKPLSDKSSNIKQEALLDKLSQLNPNMVGLSICETSEAICIRKTYSCIDYTT